MTIGTQWATLVAMKLMNWSADKNRMLIEERGISFEDIVFSLQSGCLLDDVGGCKNFCVNGIWFNALASCHRIEC